MHYRTLGTSEIRLSSVVFGAWQLGDPGYWGDDASDDDRVVAAAIDAGINFFDTAEMYGDGEAERVLGRALRHRRNEVYVATKVLPHHCAPEKLRAACEASLARLGTDYVDLYQIHWPFRDVPFADAYGELARLRDEGKIRAIGVSNFGPRDLDAWLGVGECCSNQIGYNLLFRAPEFGILPACRRHGIGVLTYMPLMQGILAGRYATVDAIPEMRRRTRHFASSRSGTRHNEPGCEEAMMELLAALRCLSQDTGETMATLALAWLLAQSDVTSVIVGVRKADQLERNLRVAELALDPAVIQRMNEFSTPVMESLGPNADIWDSGDAARIR